MAGYTPLFDTLTKGTLCGRWPDIGLWPIVLSMADRHGIVDVTQHYIATITGLPLEEVTACMDRFCEPDPLSRSQDNNGARLVRLDEHRNWGWRVVNHGKYTEKARLIHKNAKEVEDGKNKARLAAKRDKQKATADDRREPPVNAPQAQAQAQAQKKKKSARERATFVPPTVQEVAEHVRNRGSPVDAEAFVAFYSSKGWRIGKEPMRDWKAAVVTWEKRNDAKTHQHGRESTREFAERMARYAAGEPG